VLCVPLLSVASRIAATSAISCGLPAASFALIRAPDRNEICMESAGSVNDSVNPPFPCIVKIDARDPGKDTHGNRFVAYSEKRCGRGEIFGGQFLNWGRAFRQSRAVRFRILAGGFN